MKKNLFFLLILFFFISCSPEVDIQDEGTIQESNNHSCVHEDINVYIPNIIKNHSYLYDVSGTITLYDGSSAEGTTINLEKGLALVEWQKNPNSNYTTYYLDTTISYKASSKITENLQMEITKINGDYIEISEENFVINGNIEANTFSMTKDEVYQLMGLYSGEMLTITFTRK